MVEDLAIYRRMLATRLRADWQYRTSFFLYLFGQSLLAITEFAAVAVVFANVDAVAGWTAAEVAFLLGLSGLAFGLGDLFVSPVEFSANYIKDGRFDGLLIRPVGALWQLCGHEFALRRLGRSIQPTIVLVVSAGLVDVDWTPAAVLLVLLSIVCGTAIYGAVWVVTSSLAFWTVETQQLANSFTYGGHTLNRYPVDVLTGWLRRVATFVVPLSSVAYLPAAWLFDKPMPFGLPRAAGWSGPLVALLTCAAARAIWRQAIRHYRSTGS